MLVYFLLNTLIALFASNAQELNVAKNKPTRHSRIYGDHKASFAVDGINGTTYTLSQADSSGECWWQVNLEAVYFIKSINIVNADHDDYIYLQYIFITVEIIELPIYNISNIWSHNNFSIERASLLTLTKDADSMASDTGRFVTIWKYLRISSYNLLPLAEVIIEGKEALLTSMPTSTLNPDFTTTSKNDNITKLAIAVGVGFGLCLICFLILCILAGILYCRIKSFEKAKSHANFPEEPRYNNALAKEEEEYYQKI